MQLGLVQMQQVYTVCTCMYTFAGILLHDVCAYRCLYVRVCVSGLFTGSKQPLFIQLNIQHDLDVAVATLFQEIRNALVKMFN